MDENSYRRHIDALEAQNRQLRRIVKLASLSAGLLCILAIAGWKTGGIQDVLTARRLHIVNADGETVVAIAATEAHGGVMSIGDGKGIPVLALGANSIGDGFAIEGFDHARVRRFIVGLEDGTNNVRMELNSVTTPRRIMRIGQLRDGMIGVSLIGEDPKPRFELTLGANEETSLDMYNGKGGRTSCWFGREAKSTMMFLGEANTPTNNLTLNEPAGTVASKSDSGAGSVWPPPK